MNCNIGGKIYNFTKNIRDNTEIRKSFNNLALNVFGLSFENWYQNGYWKDKYIPYILLDNGNVVSNVSVNIIDCIIKNQHKRFIQLGTIMTHENYRHRGLSKFLMNAVLADWLFDCDGIYLYANDSVKDFYPLFGFEKVDEYEYHTILLPEGKSEAVKLNMENKDDVDLLLKYSKKANKHSLISVVENEGLLMFYCSQFMKDSVYYCEYFDAVIIADFNVDGSEMTCYDIFGGNNSKLYEILSSVSKKQTKRVKFGFTPERYQEMQPKIITEQDTTFFWHSSKEFIFKDIKAMFPTLSRA